MGRYRIHIAKDYLNFSAAHFITYDGHQCEPLHGHNYRTRIMLEGKLDENYYVMNFVPIKRMMRQICDALDHRMLLPLENERLVLTVGDEQVHVYYGQCCYSFPRNDVVLLPIPNTTAEMLARHICDQARDALHRMGIDHLTAIEIEVEESPGQAAIYREEL